MCECMNPVNIVILKGYSKDSLTLFVARAKKEICLDEHYALSEKLQGELTLGTGLRIIVTILSLFSKKYTALKIAEFVYPYLRKLKRNVPIPSRVVSARPAPEYGIKIKPDTVRKLHSRQKED